MPHSVQRYQLHHAAAKGDIARVTELVRARFPLNRFDETGKTALHHAVEHEHIAVAKALLAAGADPDANDETLAGNTPLSDNIQTCSLEMARLLIGHGADPAKPGWMQLSAIDRLGARSDGQADKIAELIRVRRLGKNKPPHRK